MSREEIAGFLVFGFMLFAVSCVAVPIVYVLFWGDVDDSES